MVLFLLILLPLLILFHYFILEIIIGINNSNTAENVFFVESTQIIY